MMLKDQSYVRELEKSLEQAQAALRAQHIPQNAEPERSAENRVDEVALPNNPVNPEFGNASNARSTSHTPMAEAAASSPAEVMDVNPTTRRFEFHGGSSAVAFLHRLMKLKNRNLGFWRTTDHRQVVADFQNEDFANRRESATAAGELTKDNYYPLHAFLFIDSYFKTLHFIHPILDQDVFLKRSHSLWMGGTLSRSFKALYFSVLSLGALTRTWTEGFMDGMDRDTWTRLLFERAELMMGRPGSLNDLEAVQAPIIMAQICQHQMNPNLAYTYLGIAVRIAFSTGLNRLVEFQDQSFPQDSPSGVVSRTWWALYSLEVESSFTLGRPDMLSLDCCHNRPPFLEIPGTETEAAIIPALADLSRIMRGISKKIYWEHTKFCDKLDRVSEYESDLDRWLERLPAKIRPQTSDLSAGSRLQLEDHYWLQLQRFVLKQRMLYSTSRSSLTRSGYLHAKIALYYPSLLHEQNGPSVAGYEDKMLAYVQRCKEAAMEIIESIHLTFCIHHSVRSWYVFTNTQPNRGKAHARNRWNSTTYIVFGLSILLSAFAREPLDIRHSSMYLQYINRAIEMLGIMGECRVALSIRTLVQELVDTLLQPIEQPAANLPGTNTGFGEFIDDPLRGFGFDLNTVNFFGANFPAMLDDSSEFPPV
jgi:hypothetical protein